MNVAGLVHSMSVSPKCHAEISKKISKLIEGKKNQQTAYIEMTAMYLPKKIAMLNFLLKATAVVRAITWSSPP